MWHGFELDFPDEFRQKLQAWGNSSWRLLTGHLLSNSLFTTFLADVEWMLIGINRDFSCSITMHLAVLGKSQVCLNLEALKYRFCNQNGSLISPAGQWREKEWSYSFSEDVAYSNETLELYCKPLNMPIFACFLLGFIISSSFTIPTWHLCRLLSFQRQNHMKRDQSGNIPVCPTLQGK